MTMPCPQSYIDELENAPYEKLIKERDKLIREIRYFEKHREEIMNSEKARICPSPDTVYWWNIEALGYLCTLMSGKLLETDEQE